jgi:hypothetical protein
MSRRTIATVDPMDRWLRLSVLSDLYGEPESTLRDLVKSGALLARIRGKLIYLNERNYQDHLDSLPAYGQATQETRTQSQPRRHPGIEEREAPVPGKSPQRPRLRLVDADENLSQASVR